MSPEQLWLRSPLGQQAPSPLVMSVSLASVGNRELELPRPSASEDFNQKASHLGWLGYTWEQLTAWF